MAPSPTIWSRPLWTAGSRVSNWSCSATTPVARKTLAAWLSECHDAAEVDRLLDLFDHAPDDVSVAFDESLTAIKRSHGDPRPAVGGSFIEDGPVLKVAYEFLACHLGEAIYRAELDAVRAAILTPPGRAGAYVIEGIRGEKYLTIHGLALQAAMPHVVVQTRLFGWWDFSFVSRRSHGWAPATSTRLI